jgi:hypothetical protein
MNRRRFLIGAGAAGIAVGGAAGEAFTQITAAADYSLRIAPMRLELAPGKIVETFAYNGTIPGPILRLRDSHQVTKKAPAQAGASHRIDAGVPETPECARAWTLNHKPRSARMI